MNIYGLLNYDTYSKIPITEEQFFDEYEYNIEGMFNGITLKNKICKTLKRSTDTIWLQEYLRIITQYTTRLTNQGETYTDEELFDLFKLVCIRDRFYCMHGLDIFEGITGELKTTIERQSECYINNLCDDVLVYENIYTDSVETGYLFLSNDIYDYESYIPYRKDGNILRPILWNYNENGIEIDKTQGETTILPSDIVIKHGNCFYQNIGVNDTVCHATATGAYKSNGDYEVDIVPTTTPVGDFKVVLDGVETVVDGTDIMYSNGKLTVKRAFNYNRISLTGCPAFSSNISSPCSYTFTNNSDSNKVSITIGGTPLPTASELVMYIDNVIFNSQYYTYNPTTGVLEFTITEALYNKAFSIHVATCVFSFAIDHDTGTTTVTITPLISNYTYTACDGCDLKTYQVTYELDPEAEVENTYMAVVTMTNTIVDGCKEEYLKYMYYCESGKKYLITTPYYKCYGDAAWTEGTPSDPIEQQDPEECEHPTTPLDYEYDECDGCTKIHHVVSYAFNEDTNSYDMTDTETETENGCKESEYIDRYYCEDGKKYKVTDEYYICPGGTLTFVGSTTPVEQEDPGECARPEPPESYEYDTCNNCDAIHHTITYDYNETTGMYDKTDTTTIIEDGCMESFYESKYVCEYNEPDYEVKEYRKLWIKCPNDASWVTEGIWIEYGIPFTDERCADGFEGYLLEIGI